jgi:uncharacterized protein (TIGR00369 family)
VTGDIATGLQVPPNCDLTLGLVCVDKEPGRTVWEMQAHERFANPSGVVQGGFVAACCDSAMGATVVTFAAGRPVRVANTDLRTSFLRPVAVGTRLRCEAIVVSGGRRVVFTEATVADEAGTPLARASGTYLLLERR